MHVTAHAHMQIFLHTQPHTMHALAHKQISTHTIERTCMLSLSLPLPLVLFLSLSLTHVTKLMHRPTEGFDVSRALSVPIANLRADLTIVMNILLLINETLRNVSGHHVCW